MEREGGRLIGKAKLSFLYNCSLTLSPSISPTHTHTHTHLHRGEGATEVEEIEIVVQTDVSLHVTRCPQRLREEFNTAIYITYFTHKITQNTIHTHIHTYAYFGFVLAHTADVRLQIEPLTCNAHEAVEGGIGLLHSHPGYVNWNGLHNVLR